MLVKKRESKKKWKISCSLWPSTKSSKNYKGAAERVIRLSIRQLSLMVTRCVVITRDMGKRTTTKVEESKVTKLFRIAINSKFSEPMSRKWVGIITLSRGWGMIIRSAREWRCLWWNSVVPATIQWWIARSGGMIALCAGKKRIMTRI